ncbi:MAG: VWA domain-containing protein, partial [Holophagales bacterium]|nr:VWA domain-containing protein [Holophagales bacterium]
MSGGTVEDLARSGWLELLLAVRFEQPWVLWLVVPWVLLGLLFARSQLTAVRWIHERVEPRFRRRLTCHGTRSLRWHLLLLAAMGLALLTAAAGPTVPGGTAITAESHHVILLLDASASMMANDVTSAGDTSTTRFERSREIARELVKSLPEASFALVTWSGTAALHLPLVADRALLHEALRVVEIHDYYSQTGSSFTAALDTALSLTDPGPSARGESESGAEASVPIVPQVVVLSDGEIPSLDDGEEPPDADFGDALAALAARQIPVHGLAVGSAEGQTRLIFDFRDVLAKKPSDERRVLRRYTTRRDTRHLRRMAQETDGTVATVEDGEAATAVAARLAEAIRDSPAKAAWLERATARSPVGHVPVALFLLAFILDSLLIGRGSGPRPEQGAFELERLGEPNRSDSGKLATASSRGMLLALAAALATIPACRGSDSGADSPAQRAHRENEKGIRQDFLGLHGLARQHYQRSRSFGIRAQVPTHNLALSFAREGRWAEAHQHFQAALELDPSLAEAFYHDGVTLFRWGQAELDPRACHPERTLDLWNHARDRFATTLDFTEPESELARNADADYAHVDGLLELLQKLKDDPPPEC